MGKFVVIDTNVLVSALITRNENSPTVRILKLISENKIIPVYSADIVKEYGEVLRRPKFKLPEEIIVKLLNDIVSNGYEVKDIVEVTEKLPDPKDVVFYAVTLSAEDKNAFLVTGNGKHFPVKPFIVTPAELVKMFENMDF
ncbi:MAG: putative toxin-antitoxin system toxin component, PIN family [Treponema sp.]|nr:putative toxin-antitoxin system toxin component, PIN family [Spirochaetia bacterium]MDD7458620.1 putative toxin-antitoxin system toxin component, PIN family [Spirochaetales bacterium]MDY5810708.1 putative toxin-antitoxin system toxin component, PIN family [Treponema sp.]MEE1181810.1 putative toxin-antitoxin system toxin component, PIN family [Treponema sp.]